MVNVPFGKLGFSLHQTEIPFSVSVVVTYGVFWVERLSWLMYGAYFLSIEHSSAKGRSLNLETLTPCFFFSFGSMSLTERRKEIFPTGLIGKLAILS